MCGQGVVLVEAGDGEMVIGGGVATVWGGGVSPEHSWVWTPNQNQTKGVCKWEKFQKPCLDYLKVLSKG